MGLSRGSLCLVLLKIVDDFRVVVMAVAEEDDIISAVSGLLNDLKEKVAHAEVRTLLNRIRTDVLKKGVEEMSVAKANKYFDNHRFS